MTVREINNRARTGRPVIAVYVLDGHPTQGRVIRARTHLGAIQVKCLNTGRWCTMLQAWASR